MKIPYDKAERPQGIQNEIHEKVFLFGAMLFLKEHRIF
jgi:hypothetical protein